MDYNIIDGLKINYYVNDVCIGAVVKSGDIWEQFMTPLIENFYIEGTNMIDIGANIGLVSLHHMKKFLSNNCKIYAFEPYFCDILQKNVTDNNFDDTIMVYGVAISDENKYIELPKIDINTDIDNYGGYKVPDVPGDQSNLHDYNCYKLDYFNLTNISLIKIDVEGFEYKALCGMLETLKNNNYPTIIIEIWSFSNGWVSDDIDSKTPSGINTMFQYIKTTKLLAKLGYIQYYIEIDDFVYVHKNRLSMLQNYINRNQ